jgi:YVTN family beta-propeller protein
MAFDAYSTQLYIADFLDHTVSVIDTASNTLMETVSVGSNPFCVAISPNGIKLKARSDEDKCKTEIYNSISWKAPVAFPPKRYFIYRNGRLIKTTTKLHFRDHNIKPKKRYLYRVEAQNNKTLSIFPGFGGLSFLNFEIGSGSVKSKSEG